MELSGKKLESDTNREKLLNLGHTESLKQPIHIVAHRGEKCDARGKVSGQFPLI